MPGRAQRVCTYPGCNTLSTESRCPKHERPNWQKPGPTKTTDRGYGWSWQKLRIAVLQRDSYLCQISLREGKIVSATEVDHILSKAQGGTDDMHNLQAVSSAKHKEKTQAEAEAGHADIHPHQRRTPTL